jgi:hypothetical protein
MRNLDRNSVRWFLAGGSAFGMPFAMFTHNWLAFLFAVISLIVIVFPASIKEPEKKEKKESGQHGTQEQKRTNSGNPGLQH